MRIDNLSIDEVVVIVQALRAVSDSLRPDEDGDCSNAIISLSSKDAAHLSSALKTIEQTEV